MKSLSRSVLQDTHQSFWQMASIQGACIGIPLMLIGGQIAQEDGPGSALISILVGNLLLWIIGFILVSMSFPGRKTIIETVGFFLGKPGAIIASLILLISFFSWYMFLIKHATNALDEQLKSYFVWWEDYSIRLAVFLGLLSALLSIGGIRLIKRLSVVLFPYILFFIFFTLFTATTWADFEGSWSLSFHGIIIVFSIVLSGIINLPTFFRHGKSKPHALLALTLTILFLTLFESIPILLNISTPEDFFRVHDLNLGNTSYVVLITLFVVFTFMMGGLTSIYFASAGWEMIVPHKWSDKEYVIIGLLGTVSFTFLQIYAHMQLLIFSLESFILNLGAILVLSMFAFSFVKHRFRRWERWISIWCWFLGSIVTVFLQLYSEKQTGEVLIIGMTTSILAFIFIIFIEETIWAIRNLN